MYIRDGAGDVMILMLLLRRFDIHAKQGRRSAEVDATDVSAKGTI
jgi:hypothetical protein